MKDFYCGPKYDVPSGYARNGNRYECLRRGVGVGMGIQRRKDGGGDDGDDSDKNDKKKKSPKKKSPTTIKSKPKRKTKKQNSEVKDEINKIIKDLAIIWNFSGKLKAEGVVRKTRK
jgi:hypothetical protein